VEQDEIITGTINCRCGNVIHFPVESKCSCGIEYWPLIAVMVPERDGDSDSWRDAEDGETTTVVVVA
jgi:hypothetical protein